jgi:thioredoxin reductase
LGHRTSDTADVLVISGGIAGIAAALEFQRLCGKS